MYVSWKIGTCCYKLHLFGYDLWVQAIMSPQLSSLLFLVVGISMALTPWLAAGGQLIASRFEQHDVRSLLPVESEVKKKHLTQEVYTLH